MTSFIAFLVRLIDVSRWQDALDTAYKPTFEKIKAAGFKGVVVRVGWGLVLDTLFAWFWKVLKGILARKPYWYLDYYSHKGTSTTDEEWGIEQANACYDALKADPGEAPLAIDCENCPGAFKVTYLNRASYNRVLKAFIAEWKRLTGTTVDIYCSPGFMWVFDAEILAMDLWLALYNRSLTVAQAIAYARSKGWTGRILMWQYTSDGDVNDDGIPDGLKLGMESNALDLNAWLGTVEEWSAYCGGTMPPVTPPAPEADIILEGIKLFSQRDSHWSSNKLGTSTSTLGSHGCLITCAASMLNYFGQATDPGKLNQLLTEKNLYYQGNLFAFGSLDNLFNVKLDWDNFIDCATTPAPLDRIDQILQAKFPLIVKVDFDTDDDDVDQHWVMIYGKENGEYIILDPWDGQKKTFESRYGDPARYIFRIATWKGTPQLPPAVPPVVPDQKVFTVISAGGLNVRDVPIGMLGSQVIGFYPKGTVLTSLETVAIGQDVWIRVSPWSVCAVKFNGVVYLG